MATVTHERVRTGRLSEILLLTVAVLIGIYAYVQVGLAMNGVVPANLAMQAGAFTGLTVLVHLLVRWKAPYADPVILPSAVALTGIGLAMIYRLDISYAELGRATGFAPRQLLWTVVGMAAATTILFFFKDHRVLRRYTYVSLVAGLTLLLLPLVPGLGRTINGSRIWIGVGSMTFQPGEIAKIVLAVFFAGYLVTARDNLALAGPKILGLHLPRLRDLGPILLAWAVAILVLVAQRDLGTSLLFFGFFVAMLYVATERISWVVIGLVLFGRGHPRRHRLPPRHGPGGGMAQPAGPGDLQPQSGRFRPACPGHVRWRPTYPAPVREGFPHRAVRELRLHLGLPREELGLTGLLAILAIYLILTQRGIRTGIGVRDGFGKLLCAGLSFVIAFQVFVVIGGITRIIPLTGLTMPFMAYGGSSLLSNWIIVGLLLRISNEAREPAAAAGSFAGVLDALPDTPTGESVPMPARRSGDDNPTEVVDLR